MMKHRLIIILLFCLFVVPVCIIAIVSIAPRWTYPQIWPEVFSLRSLAYLSDHFGTLVKHLWFSFLYSICTVFLTFLFCITPASAFARYDFRFKNILESILMVPALVPYMTFSMGIHFMFIKLGLTDSFIGVVLILSVYSYPYMFRALLSGFGAVGEEYAICAQNLGASYLKQLFSIELPLLLPSIIAGSTIVFLVAFSEYFLVFLIGGGIVPSYAGHLFSFLNSSDWAVSSILTLLFLIIPICLFAILDMVILKWYRKRGIVD